jgi:ADP-ribosylglycohydrolase
MLTGNRGELMKVSLDVIRGCLLGGAVGDALGAPVEFLSLEGIRAHHGEQGVENYVEFTDGKGRITDDTQMTLFTAEGLLRARVARQKWGAVQPISSVYHSYLRWLHTQGMQHVGQGKEELLNGWLMQEQRMHRQRAPGNTCLSALQYGEMGSTENPKNSSKGCGGVMRVAPVGLTESISNPFELGCEAAAITHGHPSGYLSAGVLAHIIADIISGKSLPDSIHSALELLKKKSGSEECVSAIDHALELAKGSVPSPEVIEDLGGGWVAEEALAISLYCSLSVPDDFKRGVLLSVNHRGDSDSTGAITGNILGALLSVEAIPEKWLINLEERDIIEEIAEDISVGYRNDPDWIERYPV